MLSQKPNNLIQQEKSSSFSKWKGGARSFPLFLVQGWLMAILFCWAQRSHGFEWQHHVGGGFGMGQLSSSASRVPNALLTGLHLHYAYGLNDALNLIIEGSTLAEVKESDEKKRAIDSSPASTTYLGGGVTYIIDILSWIPYVGGLVGGTCFTGKGTSYPTIQPHLQFAAGLDYQLERNWAVGLAFRYAFLFPATAPYSTLNNLFIRIEYLWGW
ncbi:outer membrane beta-barrel protein [Pajaroellobacter abortibovis]|uniref:Outer membrane protein beta-barrel domain-containing protein n=1 Tax=Pajaroellobacter abortibovis TaxID=1882918 RepID=A0A1L6MV58_9BACT|nr:outer membrane beta-barrel protein [Pajaroellobacter abortibovis]APR99376.1 hypothetical protein BCY86_00790 [Pajaroellobacter abortibovis]